MKQLTGCRRHSLSAMMCVCASVANQRNRLIAVCIDCCAKYVMDIQGGDPTRLSESIPYLGLSER